MRALLHLGLFALAFTIVSQASADHDDDDRRRERRTTIVVAPEIQHRTAQPVRAPRGPMPVRYEESRARHPNHRGHWGHRGVVEARREVYKQQEDHDEIVRITHRWKRATQERNVRAQRNTERRVQMWIDREIDESSALANHGRYVHRLHALRRQLRVSRAWFRHGRGQAGARHRAVGHKARVYDELVDLSAQQVRRARAQAREQMHLVRTYY